jgi:tetraacyldisaccharide 4'-kinase
MEQRLTELWYRERARASLLAPLGWLYGALVQARRRAYTSGWLATQRAGAPVVVVGNLTVGGTGKTPLTIFLAQQLRGAGLAVGIVSRGYRRRGREPRAVPTDADWRVVGDEPLILARRSACPTVVAADRVAGARALVARGAQVILADDGLQHLRLARDCEVVVIDGARGFGNGRMLPAGPLREPAARLRQADVVVVNGAPEHASLGPAQGTALEMRLIAQHAARVDGQAAPRPLADFRGTRVHAVAGIGNPPRFFRELRSHGLEVIEHRFADHHALTAAEVSFGDQLPVLMTEKDAVKCTAFADPRLWYVPVSAHFSEHDARELLRRVLQKLQRGAVAGGEP